MHTNDDRYRKIQSRIQTLYFLVFIAFAIAVIINRRYTVKATYSPATVSQGLSEDKLSGNKTASKNSTVIKIVDTTGASLGTVSAGRPTLGEEYMKVSADALTAKIKDSPTATKAQKKEETVTRMRETEKDGHAIEMVASGSKGTLSIKGTPRSVMITSPDGEGTFGGDVAEKEIDTLKTVSLQKVRVVEDPEQEPVTLCFTMDDGAVKSVTIYSSWLLKYNGQYYYSDDHGIRYLMPSSAIGRGIDEDDEYEIEGDSKNSGIVIEDETEALPDITGAMLPATPATDGNIISEGVNY